jgi:hypothetical protein
MNDPGLLHAVLLNYLHGIVVSPRLLMRPGRPSIRTGYFFLIVDNCSFGIAA